MGSGGTQQATQTSTTQLSPQAQQIFDLTFPKAQSFAAQPMQRFPYQTTLPFNPNQVAGQNAALYGAYNQAGDYDMARGAVGSLIGGLERDPNTMSWDPAVNPNLQGAIAAAQRPLYENLTEQILPGIRDVGVTQGYGNSRQGIAEGLAAGRTARAAGDVGSKIVQDLYSANLNAQGQRYGQNINALLGAAGMLPTLQAGAISPALTVSNVGDVQQAQQQQQLEEMMRNYNWDVNRVGDLAQAQELMNLLQGFPGSSNITTANTPKASPFGSALGGAAAGASLGSMFMPGIGTGIGALGGGLAGLLFS
jgi:hypothetical protein